MEVAKGIEKIHTGYSSTIMYHDENSLSSVLTIAYLSSMQYYFKPIGNCRPAVVLRILFIFQNRNIKLIIRHWLWN